MEIIPVSPIPAQRLAVTLNHQNCVITLRSLGGKQYITLDCNGERVFTNTIIVDRIPLKKYNYLPFIGDIACIDKQGTSDPDYQEWNSRFFLVYDEYAFKQQ